MKKYVLLVVAFLFTLNVFGQKDTPPYTWPKEPSLLDQISKWQDKKFGIIIHWGLYAQWGIVESWALCPEDENWIERKGYENDYFSFARDYRNIKTQFNPVNFNPDKWATAIKAAGAKYMIFTSKHHDGFCMYDSKFTDFKITDKACPFNSNPRANVMKEIFDAFRKEGLGVGAYFSKPDWTSPYYWWPFFPPKDRNPNYDITKHPERWKQFITYTQNQIDEIMTDYGKIDILWLDGCWVRPLNTINKSVAEYCLYPYDQDIDIKTIAKNAREKQPDLLIVDRWVQTEYENYLTPEQKTPDIALTEPWESCITMGYSWGYNPKDNFKTSKELIQLLVKVVSKGGNLLLGIGPDAKGDFDPKVYERLNEIGKWLDINGEGIYSTRPVKPYQEGKIAYTSKGNIIYAIYLPDKNENSLPKEIEISLTDNKKSKVTLLGSKSKITYKKTDKGIKLQLSENLIKENSNAPAWVFKIERIYYY